MRKLLLVIALCAMALPAFSQEEASYDLCFKWGINAVVGHATYTVTPVKRNGADALHLDCKGRTAPFFDKFYKIRERFQSWVRPSDCRPMEYRRDTDENGYLADNHYIYDWNAKVINANVKFGDNPRQDIKLPLSEGVYDITSVIQYVRSIDFTTFVPGEKRYIKVAIDDEVYDIRLKYVRAENFRVRKMGELPAFRMSFTLVAGELFDEGKELSLWLSADDKRIPLAIMVPLKVGTVWAWYSGYTNG